MTDDTPRASAWVTPRSNGVAVLVIGEGTDREALQQSGAWLQSTHSVPVRQ